MTPAEAALLLGHHQLHEAVFQVLGALAIDLETHHIVEANGRASEIFCYEMLEGVSIHELIPEALRERHQGLVEDFARRGAARHMACGVLEGRRQDGSAVSVTIVLCKAKIRGHLRGIATILEHA